MPYATRDGLRLYYEHSGSGSPAFVFVPGWCCDHTLFEPQVVHFGASSSVTSYDPRGCGRSDHGDDYDIVTLADDLAWLCDELALERPVIVGHSLGGVIGLELAARHRSLPGAVIAVDPGPFDPLPAFREGISGLIVRLVDPSADDPRPDFVRGLFLPGDDLERARRVEETMCTPTREVAAAMLESYLRWDGIAALSRCDVPLLVVLARTGGSNDPARLVSLKPDIQIGVTVGAGHFIQLDADEQLTPMIERFVRDVL